MSSFRAPQSLTTALAQPGGEALAHEILGERAASLGRAGARVEASLAALAGADEAEREARLWDAADAVQAYFVQRELSGFRKHDEPIADYGIPRAVLARLGARRPG